MLRITATEYARLVAHCYDGLPLEACGLLGGTNHGAHATVQAFVPCRNADASSRTYSIGPDGWRLADGLLGPRDLDVVGVAHSHTHTDPYPSPTDIERAANPLLAGWHYVIVSLRDDAPMTRSYRIVDGTVLEEPIELLQP
jgi:proteasome lid subunit RPN8/RPN11